MKQTIFIHVPRTAGKSMGKVFKSLQSKGIITYQDLGSPLRPKCNPAVDITNAQHISIQSLIDRDVFSGFWYDNCFKFAFVRNPWDRLVSLFEHLQYRLRRQKRQRESNTFLHNFDDFSRTVCTGRYVKPLGRLATDDWSQANPQVRWLEQGVDFIGKYENLHDDWNAILHEIGLNHTADTSLGLHNKSSKTKHYRCYYTRELEEMVYDFYIEDIDRFGYIF